MASPKGWTPFSQDIISKMYPKSPNPADQKFAPPGQTGQPSAPPEWSTQPVPGQGPLPIDRQPGAPYQTGPMPGPMYRITDPKLGPTSPSLGKWGQGLLVGTDQGVINQNVQTLISQGLSEADAIRLATQFSQSGVSPDDQQVMMT